MSLSERGLTLTEVTVVAVLATIVMLGIVGFYVSSQGVWMDASAKAITQREATTVMETITRRVHESGFAQVLASSQLTLFDRGGNQTHVFWWNVGQSGADSLIHEGPTTSQDRGPVASSLCERFQCVAGNVPGMVDVELILRSAQGERIQMATRLVMVNRP